MRRICVYCGSNAGASSAYSVAAESLATVLLQHDFELVYGGASKGTMGVLADSVLRRGGKVHGVIPSILADKEVAHRGITELHVVATMHERKAMMASLVDGFIALPGGFGTLEELIEVLTWGQLKLHGKPCGVINVGGYFDSLLAFLDHAEAEGFLRPENRAMLLCAEDGATLVEQFLSYKAPAVDKWT